MTNITNLRPEGTARPQLTESDAELLQLDSYVMHIKTTACAHCQSGAEWGELYEVWIHPTKTRLSTLNVLRPASSLQKLPIAYIRLPQRSVPVCSDCIETLQIEDLPQPTPAADRAAWAETLRRKYTPESSRSDSAKSKPEPTLDQL